MYKTFAKRSRAMERPASSVCASDVLENAKSDLESPREGGAGASFKPIMDRFTDLDEVRREINSVVNVKVGLIFGIDFTMSNRIQGKHTFSGKNLHTVEDGTVNPYQEVICILGEELEALNDGGVIMAYRFGDNKVNKDGITPLKDKGECEDFNEVLDEYERAAKTVKLGGQTNFAPLIQRAIGIVKLKKQFHVLVIVANGQLCHEAETVAAIVQASDYPLSIVVIGVGDGPWEVMEEFDDKLPKRRFDNFQFVDFNKIKASARNPIAAVALATLMEIPDQFKAILKHGLLKKL